MLADIAIGRRAAKGRALLSMAVVAMSIALAGCAAAAPPPSDATTPASSSAPPAATRTIPSAPAPPDGAPLPSVELPEGTPPDLPPTPDTLPPGGQAVPGEPADIEAFLEASRAWFGARGATLDDDSLAAGGAARCAALRDAGHHSGRLSLEAALTAADQAEPGFAREDLEGLLAIALAHWCPSIAVDPRPSGVAP